jgi:hypothetical protein
MTKAVVTVRSSHTDAVAHIIHFFKKAGQVTVEYINVVQIPHGTHCDDCKAELKLPYHYYYWSKVHRCLDCADKQNKAAEDQSKRYTHPENSILVFVEGSEVD